MAYGLSDGRAVVVVRHGFKVIYPKDVRKITPALSFPLDQPVVNLGEKGRAKSPGRPHGTDPLTCPCGAIAPLFPSFAGANSR